MLSKQFQANNVRQLWYESFKKALADYFKLAISESVSQIVLQHNKQSFVCSILLVVCIILIFKVL